MVHRSMDSDGLRPHLRVSRAGHLRALLDAERKDKLMVLMRNVIGYMVGDKVFPVTHDGPRSHAYRDAFKESQKTGTPIFTMGRNSEWNHQFKVYTT